MKKTFLTLSLFATLPVFAGETQIGRYTSVSNTASYAQQNLLATEIKLRFPEQVKTLKQAFEQLLENSGYRLSQNKLDPDITVLYEQSLPGVHRWVGPVTLREALQTIAGSSWKLDVNPVDRTVAFILDESKRHFVSKRLPIASSQDLNINTSNKDWSCNKGFRIVATSAIYYEPNSFLLSYRDKQKLDLIVNKAKQSNLGIVLNSYADPSAPMAMHMVLSKARGDVVADYFSKKGLKNQVVTNNALGATYPESDAPLSLQRVTEISLVQSACRNPRLNQKEWQIKAGAALKDTLYQWIQKSSKWNSLVYDVKNPKGQEVKISFSVDETLQGDLSQVLASQVSKFRERSEVKSLKATLYEGDKTILIKGVIDVNGEAK